MFVDDNARIQHMMEAARKVVLYTEGRSRNDLDNDEPLAVTILHYSALVGEAAKKVSRNFQDAHPEIPWKDLADMRNKLFHEYWAMDLDLVWQAAMTDIPAVLTALEGLKTENQP